jgi:hypothetical protein
MAPSTDRPTFRALVADVAARAKARLPEAVNGRIESAVKLVLAQDVTPQDDGSILVGSSTDPLKIYRLVGATCECQDFTRGQAPDGWCRHRIAAGIAKRVQELLPTEPEEVSGDSKAPGELGEVVPQPPDNSAPLPEAPASCNVYVQISGHKVQVTLRDTDEHRMLERLQILLAQYPMPEPPVRASSPAEGWCSLHNVSMRWNGGKEGRKGWHSHKTADGWCQGR